MKTFASLFTGFGGADIGAKAAGFELVWGMELDPAIAEIYNANLGNHCLTQSVLDADWLKMEKVDWLHASPPCLSFSVAKTNRKEQALDKAIAQSVCDALSALQPQWFTLENVEGYAKSKSFSQITNTLFSLGYWAQWSTLNSADFGVPQTRKRLILRAVKGGFLPALPQPVQWIGWYEAIADLIPDLPESQFAPWQLQRLPHELTSTCFVDVANTVRNCTVRMQDEPSITITAEKMRRPASTPKAFIIPGDNTSNNTVRMGDEPMVTVRTRSLGQCPHKAFVVSDQLSNGGRAWLEQGRVVAMTARALARFQSFPDWYELPDRNSLACRGIGNAVPPALTEVIGSHWETP